MTVIMEITAIIVGTEITDGIVGIASAILGILTVVFLTTITEITAGTTLIILITAVTKMAGIVMDTADLAEVHIQTTTALQLGVPETLIIL